RAVRRHLLLAQFGALLSSRGGKGATRLSPCFETGRICTHRRAEPLEGDADSSRKGVGYQRFSLPISPRGCGKFSWRYLEKLVKIDEVPFPNRGSCHGLHPQAVS